MSRLPESLPTYLQRCFGICRRTFERWCARGDVPGAYRTQGGHWRVRRPGKTMINSYLLRPRRKTRRDLVAHAIIDYPFGPSDPRDFDRLVHRVAAVKLTLSAHGISEEDIHDRNLKERDAKKYYLLWEELPSTLHPDIVTAINDPQRAPAVAATLMRVNGRKVTEATLARELGMSVDTLHRRYDKRELRRVCEELPVFVVASEGKQNRQWISSPSQPRS